MKAYSNYKDSGVQWIGKVPSHWNMAKLKYDFHIYGIHKMQMACNSLSYTPFDSVLLCLYLCVSFDLLENNCG